MICKRCLSSQARRFSGVLERLLTGGYLDCVSARSHQTEIDMFDLAAEARLRVVGFDGADPLSRIATNFDGG